MPQWYPGATITHWAPSTIDYSPSTIHRMFLGIEIGGTKLQLAVGPGDGSRFLALERLPVEPADGAEPIRAQIQRVGRRLIQQHAVQAIGIGFGGPVDCQTGRTITSYQVEGWNDFPLAEWCRRTLGLPTVVANDSDSAGLAEARFGAGQGRKVVFYSNVGSGIGGALVIDGRVYRGGSGVASELGHLRPGLDANQPDQTVESMASGWAIAAAAQARLSERLASAGWHRASASAGLNTGKMPVPPEEIAQCAGKLEQSGEHDAADLLTRCAGRIDRLTAELIAQAAVEGNQLARDVFDRACRVYGWALAQMITLLGPNVVVIGGGVSMIGDRLWLAPLQDYVSRYVFPSLKDTFQIVPAKLGEKVVLHGAMALAAGG